MKIICAWCHTTLGHKCPFCSQPLIRVNIDGRIWYRCDEPLTTIYFDPDKMKETHGICDVCAIEQRNCRKQQYQLSLEDQQTIAALDGAGNRGPGNFKTRERKAQT